MINETMRLAQAITAASLLLIAACSPPKQELTGIVQLYCFAAGGPRSDDLIVDTENWKLLNYDIDTDKFQEQKITPGFMKGAEVTWTLEKKDDILMITSREAYSEKYFKERAESRKNQVAVMDRYVYEDAIRGLQQFDKFTEDRKEDYKILRTKIDLETLSADLFEKKKFGFMDDSQATKSGTGICLVSDPPKTLMAAD